MIDTLAPATLASSIADLPAETADPIVDAHHVLQWANRRFGKQLCVTASFGVATALPSELDPTPLIARADEALYRAKRDGRNCIRVTENTDAATSDSR